MRTTTRELIDQLAEPANRAQARIALLQQGASVVNDLLAALGRSAEPDLHASVYRVLLDMADPRALDAFRRGLLSEEEEIRAISAQGLYRLGVPEALDAALATIDDSPDPLHADVTPSVRTLAALGQTALPPILSLLDSNEPRTRQHAQKAVEQITYNLVTRRSKLHSTHTLEEWQKLWKQNGNYQWDAPATQRTEALRRLRRWLDVLGNKYNK